MIPYLEPLEPRHAPTVSAASISGTLYVTGPPDGILQVTQRPGILARPLAEVRDADQVLGVFPDVAGVSVTVPYSRGIYDNLAGQTLPGSVRIDDGIGTGTLMGAARAVSVYSDHGTGVIGGGLTVTGDQGKGTLVLGFQPTGPSTDPVPAAGALVIRGPVAYAPGRGARSRRVLQRLRHGYFLGRCRAARYPAGAGYAGRCAGAYPSRPHSDRRHHDDQPGASAERGL